MIILICFGYILTIHFCDFLNDFNCIVNDYVIYKNLSNDNLINFVNKCVFQYKHYYLGAIFEELIFRLPLLYFNNNNFIFGFLVFIFCIQHYDKNKKIKTNIQTLTHSMILGYLFSSITNLYSTIFYSIALHLLNNLLSVFIILPYDFKKKNPRLVLDYLNQNK